MATYKNGVTIGAPPRPENVADVLAKMEKRHDGPHDTLIVFVPPGTARDARSRIWDALDAVPHQDPREFERDQALAHDNNIARMFGSL